METIEQAWRNELRVKLLNDLKEWTDKLAIVDQKFKDWLINEYSTCQYRIFKEYGPVIPNDAWRNRNSEFLRKEFDEIREQLRYLTIFTQEFINKIFRFFNDLWSTFNPYMKQESWNI